MRAGRRDVVRVPLESNEGNFLHKITHAEGAGMVANGTALAVSGIRYGVSVIVGYRITAPARASNSQASAPMIRPCEAMAAAGLFGRSRTARLPEWDTKLRDSKVAREVANDPEFPPEDFIELADIKIKWWKRVPPTNPKHEAWA